MKGFKRALSVILCAVMLLGSIPFAEVTGTNYHYVSAATVSSYSQGDIIEFGSYPQTKVTDESLISALNSAGGKWISYNYYSGTEYLYDGQMTPSDYMRYKDVIYGSDKYRGVVFDTYRPWATNLKTLASTIRTSQYRNGYKRETVYWFKYEPIEWQVLDPATGMVIAKNVLDSQPFNNYVLADGTDANGYSYYWGDSEKTHYANDYAESSIREWLNNDFYNTAFSSMEQYKIKSTALDNHAKDFYIVNSTPCDSCSKYCSVTTNDKVYLLSYDDVINSSYGFESNPRKEDNLKIASLTDYALCQGKSALYSNWILRTPYIDNLHPHYSKICYVSDLKVANVHESTFDIEGIRPAINIHFGDLERTKFIEDYPTLEEVDAINFLRFIYNQNDNSKISASDEDIKNDFQYKILTGDIFNEDLSIAEIQNLIADFCWLVENIINRYILDSQYMCDIMRNHLKENMEKAILNETVSLVADELVDGLMDLVSKKLGELLKIQIKSSEINEAALKLAATKNLLGSIALADDIEDFCESVDNALTISSLVHNSESFGRYSYFNAYLNNRNNPHYKEINKTSFGNIADATVAAKIINFISWITGKDSWQNHKDDIDRWAEQFYQLQLYSKKNPHKYEIVIDEPTCTEPGVKSIVCVYCDELKSTETIKPKGHTYKKTVFKPTCDKKGYDLYKCVDCDSNFTDNYTEKTEHKNYTKTTTPPTCTAYGYNTYVCKCGEIWTENYGTPKGHSYSKTIVEPTETEQGYTIYDCSECNSKYYDDYTNPTGHEFVVTVTKPTCQAEGFTMHTCSSCGYEYVDSYVDITDHSYQLITDIKATCISEGKKEYSCKDCGATSSETVAIKEHDYTYGTRIVEPTCEDQGYTVHICDCGAETKDQYIDETGHNYVITDTLDATCSTDGYTEYECSVCNHTFKDIISKTGHNYVIVETVAGNCLKSSYTLKKCTVCEDLKYENCIYADGHDVTDWETVIQATPTSKGIMKRYCVDCDYVETKEIPYKIYLTISEPKNRTILYGESMKLYSNVPDLPNGYKVKWRADSDCVSLDISSTGKTCTVTSTSTGNVVVKAYVVDSNGNIVTDENGKQVSDSEYFYSEANLWLRIVYFFKRLFGISMATAQSFNGAI